MGSSGDAHDTKPHAHGRSERGGGARRTGYAAISTRPLHVLVFLAPLIVAYEVCSALYLTDAASGAHETIRAHRLMSGFFDAFGVGGLYLPGVALVVILLIWHVLLRDPWRVRPRVLAGMLVESCAWTLPLLVLWQIVSIAMDGASTLAAAAGAVGSGALGAPGAPLSMPARLTISIGAGLYEELLFRMLAIAVLHFVFADLLRVQSLWSGALAVAGSALAFALYHDVYLAGSGVDWARLIFYFLAGVYFGVVYLWRGFGIVVAAHALYDVVVLAAAG